METKKKRMIFILLLILFLPILFYGGVNAYAILSARSEGVDLENADFGGTHFDAILVLGAGVRSNGTPSNMLEDRLLTALELYEKGVSDRILVSGDHGSEDYDEVGVMKNYLINKGVPSEDIFMDHAGFSTYDSLHRAGSVFGAESLVIVTQEYHAPRALMIGRHLGIECRAVYAPILSTEATGYVGQSWYSFRETVARCKDFIYSVFRPDPAFLGDPISLSGSGDVTND